MFKLNHLKLLPAQHKILNSQKLTDDEITKAFKIWHRKFDFDQIQNIDYSYVSIKSDFIAPKGWLKSIRQGLQLSASTVAQKLKISQSAYSKYEESEANGVITLNTMSKAAQAMDCELFYMIVPKNKKNFIEIIWDQLLPLSVNHPWIKNCDPYRKAEALAFIAGRNLKDPIVRKQLGWSQKSLIKNK